MKPNYELKSQVLQKGLTEILKKISLSKYVYNIDEEDIKKYADNEEVIHEFLKREKMRKFAVNGSTRLLLEDYVKENFTEEEIKEAERVNKASYHRVKRLKRRIGKILSQKTSVFVTMTFDPKTNIFERTSTETRRKYVQRFLNSQKIEYVANIDFGELNGQEHYHAVVNGRIKPLEWNYGNCDVKLIRTLDKDTKIRLAKYIDKLTNHAIKETTKQSKIMYSRN